MGNKSRDRSHLPTRENKNEGKQGDSKITSSHQDQAKPTSYPFRVVPCVIIDNTYQTTQETAMLLREIGGIFLGTELINL